MKAIFVKNNTAFVVEAGYTEQQKEATIKSHEAALDCFVKTEKEILNRLKALEKMGLHCPDLA